MPMHRMASTDPGMGEDLQQERRHTAELHRQVLELEGMSPRAANKPPEQLGEGDVKVQIGAGHELDELEAIEPLTDDKRITIRISHVNAHVPLLFQQKSIFTRAFNPRHLKHKISHAKLDKPTHRQILFDVNGAVHPGEVLALMGPSGSGKTSLLSVMGARAQKLMRTEGTVTFNGAPLTKRLKRRIGYVLQDDLLYEALTVYETLYYAAMLRLPRHMSHEDKLRRIDVMVQALGLKQCRDTIVGGFFRKGISGGERKRASIGVELLIDPSVLMLDEPTSGLDSTTSMHVLQLLRYLATGGRSVIATIHQPSSRLYQQLDKLLLLSQGHVMFYGQASQAGTWFNALGYTLPYGTSVADFILDLASGDVAVDDRNGEETRTYLIETAEAYLKRHLDEGFDPAGRGSQTNLQPPRGSQLALPAGGSGHSTPPTPSEDSARLAPAGPVTAKGMDTVVTVERLQGKASGEQPLQSEHRWGAPYLTQISLLFRRSLRTRRFESFKDQDILQFAAIAILAGLFWLQAGQDQTVIGARNTLGLLFFIAMFASFRSLFLALYTWPEEYKHMLKERASGMYRLSAFYAARTLSDLPMDFALPSAFFVVVYFMGGLRYNAGAFFGMYGTTLLTMLVAQGFGLLLGVITMNPKTAQTLASVVLMAMVLTGGFFVTQLPSWLDWIKYTSFIYYALGILLFLQFDGGNSQYYTCTNPGSADQCAQSNPSNPSSNSACQPVTNLQQSLALAQNPASQGDAIRNAFILLGFFLVFRVLVYVVLRRKTRGL